MRLCPGPLGVRTRAGVSCLRAGASCLLLVFFLQVPLSGQERQGATSEDIVAAARNFKALCEGCHGRDGTGGRAPDLSLGRLRFASTDDGLFRVITGGRGAAGMPAFSWLSEGERSQLVAYVRSLSAGRADVQIPGDSVAGADLFRSKGACAACHMVNGQGGRTGPDLSAIGWARSPDHLRTALVDPNQDLAPEWWSVRVVDQSGRVTEGRRMNEDTYSVRVFSLDGQLRSFEKGDLRSFERVETSLMPSYAETLTDSELTDLVAYLYALRKGI